MEQLKYLHIAIKNEVSGSNMPTFLACAAGRVPALEEFSFTFDSPYCSVSKKFVDKYGQLYPGRKLKLKALWLVYFL